MNDRYWCCFFCDEVFTVWESALEHFGGTFDAEPLCKIAAADGGLANKVRQLEEELVGYRHEDSETDRVMHRMKAEHRTNLRREEENGYAKGLADGRAIDRIHTPAEMERAAIDHVVQMARRTIENFVLEGGLALIPLRDALRTLDLLLSNPDQR